MSTEDGQAPLLKIDWLLCLVMLLLIVLVLNEKHLLAILFVLGIIFIELTAIRRAIEEKS